MLILVSKGVAGFLIGRGLYRKNTCYKAAKNYYVFFCVFNETDKTFWQGAQTL